MIMLKNVTVKYGGNPVFKDFGASLPESGTVALCGKSGSGKTTVLRLIAGLFKPSEGSISGLENKKISVVFQEDRLIEHLSALKNVEIVNPASNAEKLFDALKLSEEKNKPARELSGGMRRRTAIARALNFGGDILLLDEPLKGMEDELKQTVINAVKGAFPLTVVTVHEKREAEMWGCEKIIYLQNISE